MPKRRIEVEIIGHERSLSRALGRSAGQLATFGEKVRAAGVQASQTGRTISRGITLPVIAVGGLALKMSLDFEKAMTNIRALVGASDEQMADYKEGVLELAKTVPQGPQALADALYFVTSSGFEGAEALEVLEASARAAAAGLGDTTQVADAVTSAVNAYGDANLTAAGATDVLLATVREGKADPEELAASIGRVIAPAEAMGVSFAEVGGAVAGLTLGGLDAAEAVTGLRGILGTLLKPSEQAREVLKNAGLSVDSLREAVAKKGLLPALQDLRDRFGKNKDALGKLFPNVRALNSFLALTGRNAKKNQKAMDDVRKSTGDTSKAFAEAAEDPLFKLQQAWSKLRVELINLGTVITPIATAIAGFLSTVLEKFQGLSPQTKKMIAGFVLVAAAIGPLLVVIGGLITLIGVIASPIGLVILALIALGAGLVVLYTKSETFRKLVGQAWVYIQEQAQRFLDWYRGTLQPAIENVLTALSAAWDLFGDDIIRIVGTIVDVVLSIIRPWLRTIKSLIEFVLALIRGDWSAAWGALKGIVSNALQTVGAILLAWPRIVFAYARAIGGKLWEGIKAGVGALGAKVGELLARAGSALLSYADRFYTWASSLGRAIVDGIIDAISGLGSAIMDALPGGGIVSGALDKVGIELANGARNFGGGLAIVGERGPELVNLPRGSDVYSNRESRMMLGGSNATNLEGMRIAGRLDLASGQLDGTIIGHLEAAGRQDRRRRRMGAHG